MNKSPFYELRLEEIAKKSKKHAEWVEGKLFCTVLLPGRDEIYLRSVEILPLIRLHQHGCVRASSAEVANYNKLAYYGLVKLKKKTRASYQLTDTDEVEAKFRFLKSASERPSYT